MSQVPIDRFRGQTKGKHELYSPNVLLPPIDSGNLIGWILLQKPISDTCGIDDTWIWFPSCHWKHSVAWNAATEPQTLIHRVNLYSITLWAIAAVEVGQSHGSLNQRTVGWLTVRYIREIVTFFPDLDTECFWGRVITLDTTKGVEYKRKHAVDVASG